MRGLPVHFMKQDQSWQASFQQQAFRDRPLEIGANKFLLWWVLFFFLRSFADLKICCSAYCFSGEFSIRQAQREVLCKSKKSWFFLLGLNYTLRTCFDTINFLPKISQNSCKEEGWGENSIKSLVQKDAFGIQKALIPPVFFF